MAGRLFNMNLDEERYFRLKKEVEDSNSTSKPITATAIVKESLDMRWEKMDGNTKRKKR